MTEIPNKLCGILWTAMGVMNVCDKK
jgi:hypothetical protein